VESPIRMSMKARDTSSCWPARRSVRARAEQLVRMGQRWLLQLQTANVRTTESPASSSTRQIKCSTRCICSTPVRCSASSLIERGPRSMARVRRDDHSGLHGAGRRVYWMARSLGVPNPYAGAPRFCLPRRLTSFPTCTAAAPGRVDRVGRPESGSRVDHRVAGGRPAARRARLQRW
jgi:hypothetical protein